METKRKTDYLFLSFFYLFCFVFVCTNVHTLLGSSVMSCRVMLCHVVTYCRFMFDVFCPTGDLGILFRDRRCCASALDIGCGHGAALAEERTAEIVLLSAL